MTKQLIITFLIINLACTRSTQTDTLISDCVSSTKIQTIKFPVDNTDSTKFGFLNILHDNMYEFEFSVSSLCISDSFVFVLDEVHRNVKRININSLELHYSSKIMKSGRGKKLEDIEIFNNKIYVTTFSDTVFVFDKELDSLCYFRLPTHGNDPMFVYSKTDSTLSFYVEFTDSIYTINNRNEVVASGKIPASEIYRWRNKFCLEKGIVKDKKIVYSTTDSTEHLTVVGKTIKLQSPFNYYAEAINLTYNDKYLIIFDINPTEFTLYAYILE
jgi:hypothetical protein